MVSDSHAGVLREKTGFFILTLFEMLQISETNWISWNDTQKRAIIFTRGILALTPYVRLYLSFFFLSPLDFRIEQNLLRFLMCCCDNLRGLQTKQQQYQQQTLKQTECNGCKSTISYSFQFYLHKEWDACRTSKSSYRNLYANNMSHHFDALTPQTVAHIVWVAHDHFIWSACA